MDKRFKTRAKFENGLFKPSKPVNLSSGEEVELIVIREVNVAEEDISDSDLMELANKNPSFDFLKDEEEDIYSINDLKKRYK